MTPMSTWDSHMTSAARVAGDAFLKLQQRRLGVVAADPSDQPHGWSEISLGVLGHLSDCQFVPALWRLTNLAMEAKCRGEGAAAAAAYLQWHTDANQRDDDDATAERSVQVGMAAIDFGLVSAVVQMRLLCGNLAAAGRLTATAVQRVRELTPLSADEEAAISDVLALFMDPFTSAQTFPAWRARAKDLLLEARYVLESASAEESEDTPAVVLKLLLLDMLIVASGDREHLARLVRALDLDAVWYVGGVAAAIEPFAALTDLGRAFVEFEAQSDPAARAWFAPFVRSVLTAQTTHDLVEAVAVLSDVLPADLDPHTRLASLLLCAHVADILAPIYAAGGKRGRVLATRNRLVANYAGMLAEVPLLWRIAAQYLLFSPLSPPALLVEHLSRTAAAPGIPGPRAV